MHCDRLPDMGKKDKKHSRKKSKKKEKNEQEPAKLEKNKPEKKNLILKLGIGFMPFNIINLAAETFHSKTYGVE